MRQWLDEPLAELFFAQGPADQRHGYEAAGIVAASESAGVEMIQAAALHDIGKRQASLGVIGRTLASLAILFRLPLTRRMAVYRDHGAVAAEELEAAGAPKLVVDFARHHHGSRPESIDPDDWAVLVLADEPPKARKSPEPPIISKNS